MFHMDGVGATLGLMSDVIRDFTSLLLHLNASLLQCTGWLALMCLPKAEKIFEKA